MRHLIMRLESPLMAFGGETIDNYGVIRPFPAVSMLTGLLANALGLRRVEAQRHQDLQDRLVFAARIDREPSGGVRMTDFQTVKLYEDDRGWTTRGRPEGREKSPTYRPESSSGRKTLTWRRWRDYWADAQVTVALRLEPPELENEPTLDQLAAALQEPKRPLFIGRKPCLPSGQLFSGFCEGETALAALLDTPIEVKDVKPGKPPEPGDSIRILWPDGQGVNDIVPNRTYLLTDQRNWVSGLHGGGRTVCEGSVPRQKFGPPAETESPQPPDKENQE